MKCLRFFFILAAVMFVTTAHAQYSRTVADMFPEGAICTAQPKALTAQWSTETAPLPGLEQLQKHFGQMPSTSPFAIPTQTEEETRFSWWGYGHRELHAKDKDSDSVIDELHAKFGKNACCNGMDSGECRISKFAEEIDPLAGQMRKRVIVDGEACDVSSGTKFAALNSFKKPGFIVVCAAKTYRSAFSAARSTCSTYCIGTAGGF